MMKLTTLQVLNAYNWMMSTKAQPMSYKTAFRLSVNAESMIGIVKSFEEQRLALLDRYAKKDAKGKPKTDKNGQPVYTDAVAMDKEFNELTTCEVEVPVNKIPVNELEGLVIPLEQMMLISFLFEQEV